MCQAEESKADELVLKYQIWGGLLLSKHLGEADSASDDEEMKGLDEGGD